jgi:hypothetical protein
MDLWLFALIALALIPVVRVFMAAGCPRREPPPPGDQPLFVIVTTHPYQPNGEPVEVHILSGVVRVHSPTGRPPIERAFGEGGLPLEEFRVAPEAFEGETSPYGWSAECSVDYEVTSPLTMRTSGTARGGHPPGGDAWNWDANRNGTLTFTLRLIDEGAVGTERPTGGRRLVWRLPGGFGESGTD